ncbi:uncharacterized protein P174DRAFT_468478 [Aspergillus novofumigatus IBT 16806]|uniref:Uncharacterized protein n=1 Tax=Aspergillus novofumigatus (strain IBT 16806) TaxID=1392255 RepID=A0A2I1CN82_ASPN1|nr:uncharacterized protein P174DRAFT_468478 [Aspergillus novofumigatus IBT 16806]PKX99080.1 hypothetical protein P174DRAFT_468478 [Aspergillus novofumigatus IBT 16806]
MTVNPENLERERQGRGNAREHAACYGTDNAVKTIQARFPKAVARLEAHSVWFLMATPIYNRAFDMCGCLLPSREVQRTAVYNQYRPSFVIEAGWSDSHRRLIEDKRVWMVGDRPYVRITLIVKFTQNDRTNLAHECHFHWMREVEFAWREQSLGSRAQGKNGSLAADVNIYTNANARSTAVLTTKTKIVSESGMIAGAKRSLAECLDTDELHSEVLYDNMYTSNDEGLGIVREQARIPALETKLECLERRLNKSDDKFEEMVDRFSELHNAFNRLAQQTDVRFPSLGIKPYTKTFFTVTRRPLHVVPFPRDGTREQYEVWSLAFNDPIRRSKKTSWACPVVRERGEPKKKTAHGRQHLHIEWSANESHGEGVRCPSATDMAPLASSVCVVKGFISLVSRAVIDHFFLLKFPAAALPEAQAVVAAQLSLEVAHPNAADLACEAVSQAAWAFRARVRAVGGPLPHGAPPSLHACLASVSNPILRDSMWLSSSG